MDLTSSEAHLISTLRAHPQMRERITELLNIAGCMNEDVRLAGEAEERILEELQHLGRVTLQGWADRYATVRDDETRAMGRLKRAGKKRFAGTPNSA